MTAHLKVPDDDGSMLDLIVSNTHFNAGGEAEVRLNQAREMRSAIDRYLNELKETEGLNIQKVPVFGVGDFNTGEWDITRDFNFSDFNNTGQLNFTGGFNTFDASQWINNSTVIREDYQRLLDVLGSTTAEDIFRSLYPRDVDTGLTTSWNRIDYVFGLSGKYEVVGAGVDKFVETANPDFRLSDHWGTYATVKLEKISEDSTPPVAVDGSGTSASGWWFALSLSALFFILVSTNV